MADGEIRFVDGTAYEQGMGRWSRPVGEVFLDWLAPPPGWRWLDVGCGSGVVSELLMQRCAPAEVHGIDPSEAQLDFARSRPGARGAVFQAGDAMALPFADKRFDAAVTALVLFFLRDPDKGLAEMARVVRAGGMVAAYLWDAPNGGAPFAPIQAELHAMGVTQPAPPSIGIARVEALRELWTRAGLQAVEMREIAAQRHFADFDAFWSVSAKTGRVGQAIAAMPAEDVERLKQRVRARVAPGEGAFVLGCRANAIKGRVPDWGMPWSGGE